MDNFSCAILAAMTPEKRLRMALEEMRDFVQAGGTLDMQLGTDPMTARNVLKVNKAKVGPNGHFLKGAHIQTFIAPETISVVLQFLQEEILPLYGKRRHSVRA